MQSDKDSVSQYISKLYAVQDKGLRTTRDNTPQKGLPAISIQPEEGRFLQVLVRASGARRALEIGTLGGYSGIWIARGLVQGGKLITLEKEQHHAEVAREHFATAGVLDRVEVRVGDAHRTLQTLSNELPFDFVFIDAEKAGYPSYFDWALEHTTVGALITAHNVLRGGQVASLNSMDESTKAMHAFNLKVSHEPRVMSTIYPGGDGIIIAVKLY